MRRSASAFVLALVLASASCSLQEGGAGMADEPVNVRLAMSVGNSASTKADVNVFTELRDDQPQFSGMTGITIKPFNVMRSVTLGDEALDNVIPRIKIGQSGLQRVSNAHFFGDDYVFPVPRKTASFLVYGRAEYYTDPENQATAVTLKHINGSLVEDGLDGSSASAIRFRPEPMLNSSSTPGEAVAIAAALTSIVSGDPFQTKAYFGAGNSQSVTVSVPWDATVGDENLLDCYQTITAGGALLPGSGANVEAMLTSLYRSLYSYNVVNSNQYEVEKNGVVYPAYKADGTPLTYAYLYNGVKNVILGRFNSLHDEGVLTVTGSLGETPSVIFNNPSHSSYPEQYGLPSGAAVVRWTSSGYVVPLENGHDGIAPISAYCFPPPLYYYADSEIVTTNDAAVPEQDNTEKTWSQILSDYKDGGVVTSSTRAIAIKEPMHFAVGMLKASVKASSEYLQDNDNLPHTVAEATGSNFPLTGVVVGRQYPQRFDFTPDYVSEVASKQYYLYDNRISDIYLAPRSDGQAPQYFRTLVLQTPDNKDTYFCLEFRNDSGKSFYGAEGRILPGHMFYMVGKLTVPTAEGYPPRVFTRDMRITMDCTITSLRNAHSAVPDMGIPQLTVGVETQVNWVMTDPLTLMFE